MSVFEDEDNNPFAGSDHLFASGIGEPFGFVPDQPDSSRPLANSQGIAPDLYAATTPDDETIASEDRAIGSSYNIFGEASIVESTASWDSKQKEYEQSMINQASSVSNPLEYYSDNGGDSNVAEVIRSNAGIQVDIPYIIQLKDKRSKVVIVYIVKLKDYEIRRRYSDFDKLRRLLVKIYPTLVLPLLPEKHSFRNYVFNPLNVQRSDLKFIERRKRALRSFINKLMDFPNELGEGSELPPIKYNEVFLKFLDPSIHSFQEISKSPLIALLQRNPLLSDPINPYAISPYHNLLPTPLSSSLGNYDQSIKSYMSMLELEKRKHDEQGQLAPAINYGEILDFPDYEYFKQVEAYILKFSSFLLPIISCNNDIHRNLQSIVKNLSKLGAFFNGFSLEYNFSMTFQPDFKIPNSETDTKIVDDDDIQQLKRNLESSQNKDFEQFYTLSSAIEKIGQSIDNEFINIEMLDFSIASSFEEPLNDLNRLLKNCTSEVLKFKKLKDLQFLSVTKRLKDKEKLLNLFVSVEQKYQRLEHVLKSNSQESPTIKQAYHRLEIQKQKEKIKEQQIINRYKAYSNINGSSPDLASLDLSADQIHQLSFDWLNLFTGTKRNPDTLTGIQREQEIKRLRRETLALKKLAQVASDDVKKIAVVLKQNIKNLIGYVKLEIMKLNLKFSKIFLKFLKENLVHWERIHEYINNNIYELKFNYKYDNRLPRYIRYPNEELLRRKLQFSPENHKELEKLEEDYLNEAILKHNSKVGAVNPIADIIKSTKVSALDGNLGDDGDVADVSFATSYDSD